MHFMWPIYISTKPGYLHSALTEQIFQQQNISSVWYEECLLDGVLAAEWGEKLAPREIRGPTPESAVWSAKIPL